MNFISSLIKKPLQKLQRIKQSIEQQISPFQIIQIHKNLYHIDYPNQKNISSLISHLKNSQQFQVWNISQYPYDQNILCAIVGQGKRNSDGNQVVFNLSFQLFANIPFCQLIKACQMIQHFLAINQNNKVFIHCQDNKRRSAIFLASYTFLTGKQDDIVKSILKINNKLNFCLQDKDNSDQKLKVASKGQEQIYKSQHLVLKNLYNYLNNHEFINKFQLKLLKILINFAPKINSVVKIKSQLNQQSTEGNSEVKIPFKVLLQIRSQSGIKFRKIFDEKVIQGEAICIKFQQNCILSDQFLIIIKYVIDKKAYSVLRSQLNTNFIFNNFCRVHRQDLDLSVQSNFKKNKNIFMDLMFQVQKQLQSQLSQLNIIKESAQKAQVQDKLLLQPQGKEEDDQFNILNEQQEEQHQLRLQRQVEQQLQQQLKKIKSKNSNQKLKQKEDRQLINLEENIKTNFEENKKTDLQKNQKTNLEKDKKIDFEKDKKTNPEKDKKTNLEENKKQQTQTYIIRSTKQNHQKKNNLQLKLSIKNNQISLTQTQLNQQIQNKKQQEMEKLQQLSQSNSDEPDSVSSQEQPDEEDLQQYLSKLEKQAEKL